MTDNQETRRQRRVVRLTMEPGRQEELRTALLDLRKETLEEPACAEFDFYRSLADDAAFLLVEDFTDSAALDEHLAKPYTQAFFKLGFLKSAEPISREWLA
ncbi:antibiotic biosynthesis monooxygenase [Rhizobium cremeum]|uniref:putative quinol monooxygenase n=1 Tax=Rhizobium cremeum TaxID=2813827 RepID=UPI000DDFEF10|nr:putative quinol monooxygenase [Rhizobium cremeum]MCJ7996260.1 antibiotic biosynthesis monooxygenase [Rhizobium cremeum]MCJ8001519.1 antibiotic biosynthesis monooxygenase [Rhizobium cremeum]